MIATLTSADGSLKKEVRRFRDPVDGFVEVVTEPLV
jgi:hypothetical protein